MAYPLESESLDLPNMGLAPGAAPMLPQGGGESSALQQFQQVMRTVLPLMAATAAYRKGSLGSFTGGFLDAQQQSQRQQMMMDDRQFQRDRYTEEQSFRQQQEQRRIDQAEAEATRRQAAAAEAQESRVRQVLQNAIKPLAGNPIFTDGVTDEEAGSMAINVPGVGSISLLDAMEKIGIVKDEEGVYYPFEQPKPEKPAREPLVTGVGPDGRPTRVPDKEGVRVYERPRVPEKPPKPSTHRYRVKDDDPDSETFGQTFSIIEDEAGNIISRKSVSAGGASTPAPQKIGRFTVEVEP